MAPRARFELATLRLTAECSTVELPGNRQVRSFILQHDALACHSPFVTIKWSNLGSICRTILSGSARHCPTVSLIRHRTVFTVSGLVLAGNCSAGRSGLPPRLFDLHPRFLSAEACVVRRVGFVCRPVFRNLLYDLRDCRHRADFSAGFMRAPCGSRKRTRGCIRPDRDRSRGLPRLRRQSAGPGGVLGARLRLRNRRR